MGWRWLIGCLAGAVLGAVWGFVGNDYEPGDSAIGTGLLLAVVGFVAGIAWFTNHRQPIMPLTSSDASVHVRDVNFQQHVTICSSHR
jgi:ABC-type uncharacterized transport system permease subunit